MALWSDRLVGSTSTGEWVSSSAEMTCNGEVHTITHTVINVNVQFDFSGNHGLPAGNAGMAWPEVLASICVISFRELADHCRPRVRTTGTPLSSRPVMISCIEMTLGVVCGPSLTKCCTTWIGIKMIYVDLFAFARLITALTPQVARPTFDR